MATIDLIGDSKVQKIAAPVPVGKRLPPNAGKGRAKGVPNKLTAAIRAALAEALELAGQDAARLEALDAGKTAEEAAAIGEHGGAVDYLRRLAMHEPRVFAALLARMLPVQVVGDEEGGPVRFTEIRRVIVDGRAVQQQQGKAG
jgi:hypothetical protein